MQTTIDHGLFLFLNFDGGPVLDRIMLTCSAIWVWFPLYALLIGAVWRRAGWRNALLFLLLAGAAVGLADMLSGMFKHVGLLRHALPDFPPRLRPMHTPELEGLVHVVKGGGRYGTISAHAATLCSIAVLAASILRRRWVTTGLALWVALVCYSRIYLAFHFPLDILYGLVLGGLLGAGAAWCYGRLARRRA